MSEGHTSGGSTVSRLRVSYVAATVNDGIKDIGGPQAFAQRLRSLAPVQGLPVTLPFEKHLPIDLEFWTHITDGAPLTAPISDDLAPKLRRAGLPLRVHGQVRLGAVPAEPAVSAPRLELHLHPFGVAAAFTVDLSWTRTVPLSVAEEGLRAIEDAQAHVALGGTQNDGAIKTAVTAATGMAVNLLAGTGSGTWPSTAQRIATVVQGGPPIEKMPRGGSDLHLALHKLSSGGAAPAAPSTAFVATWTGAAYGWPSNNLVYVLDSGAALLPSDSATGNRASDHHRRVTLTAMYVGALSQLVRTAPKSSNAFFPEWARTAANHLGRLYGPSRAYRDWGLTPRALMDRAGLSEDVRAVLGIPLTPSAEFTMEPYAE